MDSQPRKVFQIVEPQPVVEGAGVRLKRVFPGRTLDYPDPFLLFDHFGSDNPDDYLAGFPMHPHRGIETVTYMLAGAVHHKDSIGNSGVIEAGDVQWMTAGGGILHEEMPQPRQGRMAGFQLWVNLPARLKMTRPRYQEIAADRIPQITHQDGVKIRVIAGTVNGVTGPVTEIAADPVYLDVSLPAQTSFSHAIQRGHTALAYVFEGEGVFGLTGQGDGERVSSPKLIVFDDGDYFEARSDGGPVRFLVMSGKPSHEPIVRYGPFVMNTRQEIQQALHDLQNGTFIWREAC
jgi:redox-sensitive bicupin YhaK (pirin superfamily)